MTSRNSSCGTCRPRTTRHTVSGVDSSNPTGPNNQVQKVAAAISATEDRPVLAPYTQGSSTFATTSSTPTNSRTTQTSSIQPGSTATASATGKPAAMMIP